MVRLLLALVLTALLAGCGSAPPTSPPAGVDQLDIPTPSPDPGDFIGEIDNPWLPLTPGSEWTYERATLDGLTPVETVTVTVVDEPQDVTGVATTVVEQEIEGATTISRFYAQDEAGNVWLLGESGGDADWEAGMAGAQAGLAMAASPRLGDGYRLGLAEGVFEDIAEVTSVAASVEVTGGRYADVLLVEETSTLEEDRLTELFYARGVGLVLSEESGSGETLTLVAHSEG